ncbi:unnamed protein product [Camellia sinensis]
MMVLRALRRLKGTSNNKKEKMPAETKQLFDQLTEDAMKLMENDVYDEKQEVFQREAEIDSKAEGFNVFDERKNGVIEFDEFVHALNREKVKQMVIVIMMESDVKLADELVEAIINKSAMW